MKFVETAPEQLDKSILRRSQVLPVRASREQRVCSRSVSTQMEGHGCGHSVKPTILPVLSTMHRCLDRLTGNQEGSPENRGLARETTKPERKCHNGMPVVEQVVRKALGKWWRPIG